MVGKPEVKVDAVKLAKGNPAFTDDIEPRGMLYARLLTSPHAHARIVAIDDTKARALPGVHAVLHHGNVARIKYASGGQSWPNPHPHDQVSFDTKVRHVGDRVAVVAAETEAIAEEAVGLIDVTYEVLPAIFDERDAMAEGAPVIHDEDDTEEIFDPERNIVHQITAQRGDVEAALATADHVFHPDVPGPPGPAVPDRAPHRHRLARRGRADGDPHRHPGPLPHPAYGGPPPGHGHQGRAGHQAPHRGWVRSQAGDADRGHRRSPGHRHPPPLPPRAHPLRGVHLQPDPVTPRPSPTPPGSMPTARSWPRTCT